MKTADKLIDRVRTIRYTLHYIRGSKGFDRGLAAGEAIRCDTLIAQIN